jgi:hypothetical protein
MVSVKLDGVVGAELPIWNYLSAKIEDYTYNYKFCEDRK